MNPLQRLLRLKRGLAPLAAAFERYCPDGAEEHHVLARIGPYEITCGCLRVVDQLNQLVHYHLVKGDWRDEPDAEEAA